MKTPLERVKAFIKARESQGLSSDNIASAVEFKTLSTNLHELTLGDLRELVKLAGAKMEAKK